MINALVADPGLWLDIDSVALADASRVGYLEPYYPAGYFKRVHLQRSFLGGPTHAPVYVANPAQSTTENPAPGTNLQYEIYLMQIYTNVAQTGAGVSIEGLTGNTATVVWQRPLPAGASSIAFSVAAPLEIGEGQIVTVSASKMLSQLTFELFGAVRPVN